MKTVRSILKILSVVIAAAAVALFFFDFVSMTVGGEAVSLSGVNLALSTHREVAGQTVDVFTSGYYTAAGVLTLLTAGLAVYGLFKTAAQVWALVISLVNGVLLAVINSGGGSKYVDIQQLDTVGKVAGIKMSMFAWLACGAAFAVAVFACAALLVNDLIISRKTGKPTIFKKCVKFLKEYKVELKKVTWPTWANVVKNTIVVIVVSAIIGVLVWLLDWGLSELMKLIVG